MDMTQVRDFGRSHSKRSVRAARLLFKMAATDSSASDSETDKRVKKRRNPAEWKANLAKRLRAEGKEYVSPACHKHGPRKTVTSCRWVTEICHYFEIGNFNAFVLLEVNPPIVINLCSE